MEIQQMRVFMIKKIPKENACCTCLSVILLDSVIGLDREYYPQTLLEKCKYEIKKNKKKNLINDDWNLSSSDYESVNESDDESNHESSNESVNEYDDKANA